MKNMTLTFSCCMKLHEAAWNYMELHKKHGKHDSNIFMLHGTAWSCMKQHGTAWNGMKQHGTA
jgi:hypothetical protein